MRAIRRVPALLRPPFLCLALALLPAACAAPAAAPPREAALGTPAARVAAESFAAVLHPAGGLPHGGAVAIGPRHLLTSGHVARNAAAVDRVRLQRGDGAAETAAVVVAYSDRLDLAVIEAPEGFARPAPAALAPPRAGDPIWAVGPHRLGRALAAGRVAGAAAVMPGLGEGFTARMPALMGFSGGPVVDREGRLAGLTTAALGETRAAQLAALLAGVDVAGLAFGEGRRIFVLGADAALAEARRLLLDGGMASPHRGGTEASPPRSG